jgi:hypothetical protein
MRRSWVRFPLWAPQRSWSETLQCPGRSLRNGPAHDPRPGSTRCVARCANGAALMAVTTTKPGGDVGSLCRALEAPSLGAAVERVAQRTRADGWTHEAFLAACLEREVAARAPTAANDASAPVLSIPTATMWPCEQSHRHGCRGSWSGLGAARRTVAVSSWSSPSLRVGCGWHAQPARTGQ